MKISILCSKLFETLSKNNFQGATIDIKGKSPTKGFMVSTNPELERQIDGAADFKDIVVYISDNKKFLNDNPDKCIDVWFDANTKKTFLDISSRMTKLSDAINQAKTKNQLAIFDLETKTELRIK
jgi:hypothetical protein